MQSCSVPAHKAVENESVTHVRSPGGGERFGHRCIARTPELWRGRIECTHAVTLREVQTMNSGWLAATATGSEAASEALSSGSAVARDSHISEVSSASSDPSARGRVTFRCCRLESERRGHRTVPCTGGWAAGVTPAHELVKAEPTRLGLLTILLALGLGLALAAVRAGCRAERVRERAPIRAELVTQQLW